MTENRVSPDLLIRSGLLATYGGVVVEVVG